MTVKSVEVSKYCDSLTNGNNGSIYIKEKLRRKVFLNDVLCFLVITLCCIIAFYPRDAMLARVFAIATCLSVRPSVCPSVTRRYCA